MELLAILFLIPATIAAVYYFVLTLLGRLKRTVTPSFTPKTRFAILIPAHDEALSLPATLASLARLDYPQALKTVFVIADNCSDDTASIARGCNVEVIERNDPTKRGKGYGLEYALNQILHSNPDAVLMFDADGELAPDSLRVFDTHFQGGDRVVQGSIRTRNAGDGPSAAVAAVGNVMDDAISTGRDVLGLRVPLRGSNMAFRREVLEAVPWTCHGLTEDAEYSAKLCRAGIRVRFEPKAKARSESPATISDLTQQRRRWNAAFRWLDSKPVVLLQLLLTTFVVVVSGSYLVWLGGLWLMTILVYTMAIREAELKLQRSMLWVVAGLALLAFSKRQSTWLRTRRVAESLR